MLKTDYLTKFIFIIPRERWDEFVLELVMLAKRYKQSDILED